MERPLWMQWTERYSHCCGVDEAGRGPLAGPVVAAAVILPTDGCIEGLTDSKKMTERKRSLLYDEIVKVAIAYGVGVASVKEIDAMNILQATFLAMRRAVLSISVPFEAVLVDGNQDPGLSVPTLPVIKGDQLVSAISAASILAKVTRDRMMIDLEAKYPGYDLAGHKGYGTKVHMAALSSLGPSPCHRRSFRPVRMAAEKRQLEVCE